MRGKKNTHEEKAEKQKNDYHQIWDWSSWGRKEGT